jgi:hypothetical protein
MLQERLRRALKVWHRPAFLELNRKTIIYKFRITLILLYKVVRRNWRPGAVFEAFADSVVPFIDNPKHKVECASACHISPGFIAEVGPYDPIYSKSLSNKSNKSTTRPRSSLRKLDNSTDCPGEIWDSEGHYIQIRFLQEVKKLPSLNNQGLMIRSVQYAWIHREYSH